MLVPANLVALRLFRRVLGVSLLFLLAVSPAFAKGPEPAIRIPLDSLDFLPLNQEFLASGASMLTLHYVDGQHLLVTFNARTLLKRIPGDPPDDLDRNVAAFLLELPSGRILARTEWRFHDHGQYLWNLGHGRFLLRVRDTLTTIAPLANLATGDPFHQRPFLSVGDRHIGYLFITPDSDLLILETREKRAETKERTPSKPPLFGPAPPASSASPDDQSSNGAPVQVNFYRLGAPPGSGDQVLVRSAGTGRARAFGGVLATAAGYLDLIDQGHKSWAFNFNTFAGKVNELSPFDSTCRPSPVFVSHSEFIAFGCHLGGSRQVLGGFNMRGEEMWEQNIYGDFIAPYLAFAPATGRFALGRVMALAPIVAVDSLSQSLIKSQNVAVYQTDSGSQILKVDCSPVELAGQNFAFSPDGMSFGVVREGEIEIYKLPPLTSKEQAAVKLAQASEPPVSDLPVQISAGQAAAADPAGSTTAEDRSSDQHGDSVTPNSAPNSAVATSNSTSGAPPSQPTNPANSQPAQSTGRPEPAESASGDPESSGSPRKPPTLYNLPGAQPDPSKDQPK